MTTAWIEFHLLLRHNRVFLSILLQGLAYTLLINYSAGVPRGQQGPLAGCGAAHLGDAKAGPASPSHAAASLRPV